MITQEIVDDLEAVLEQFRLIAADLASDGGSVKDEPRSVAAEQQK